MYPRPRKLLMKGVICLTIFLLVGYAEANAQCPVMPVGYLCISQAAGNAAAENKRELDATKEKVTVLEAALADKDKLIAEVQATADKSVNDLKDQNSKLLVQFADKSGALGECRADKVMYTQLIEFLAKNQKSKQNGAFNIKLGGN